jgi:SPASM domain peptide maturase of grasp-with-spasm system
MDNYFVLFANCIPCKGQEISLICDYQRSEIYRISNDLYKIIELSKSITYDELVNTYPGSEKAFEFLINQELGFITDNTNYFPPLSLNWDTPSLISNLIIEIDKNYNHRFDLLFKQVDELSCHNILLKVVNEIEHSKMKYLLDLINKYEFKYVEIWIDKLYASKRYLDILKQYKNVRKIKIFNSEDNSELIYKSLIIQTTKYSSFKEYCIHAKTDYLIDLEHYCESIKYNSCLNRKVSVTADGTIKNCLYKNETFGNYLRQPLVDIVMSDNFKKLWYKSIDSHKFCSNCECRYICTACKEFCNPESIPLSCNYKNYLKH